MDYGMYWLALDDVILSPVQGMNLDEIEIYLAKGFFPEKEDTKMDHKHNVPKITDIHEMLNGAVDILNNSEDSAQIEPVLYAFALAQCSTAAYLGQIAETLGELLAMAKAEDMAL
jgi:hypothetical protein